jgi:4-amino-4-deoxy-L-arabinose transferase-like glycosyltransferase
MAKITNNFQGNLIIDFNSTFMRIIFILIIAAFLRVYELDRVPPGFYADEASWAYNAYSIFLTGRDEFGRFLPWSFEAFGDYKLGVTVYSILPAFAFFGVSDWSARLPTAIYGVLTVYGTYLLCRELQKQHSPTFYQPQLPILAAGILALTPGHIFMSRGIWDVQTALCYTVFGIVFFLRAIRLLSHQTISLSSLRYFLLSAVTFVLSMYSYNSSRVLTPLILLFLFTNYFKSLFPNSSRKLIIHNLLILTLPVSLSLLLLLPQLMALTAPQVLQRARYVSIFQHGEVESKLYAAIQKDPSSQPFLFTRFLHNKPVFYSAELLQNYLSHYELNFLFLTGDTFEIFQVQGSGILLLLFLPFLIFGLYASLRYNYAYRNLAWFLLLISPIPSALTIFTPSVSRAQLLVIPLAIFTASGLLFFIQVLAARYPRLVIQGFLFNLSICLLFNLSYWFHQYYTQNPPQVAAKWNDGWRELSAILKTSLDQNTPIIISNSQAPSYIFLSWYWRIPPSTLWQTRVTDPHPDSNGLNTTTQILNQVYFSKQIKSSCREFETPAVCVGFLGELENSQIITNSYSQPIFQFYKPQ